MKTNDIGAEQWNKFCPTREIPPPVYAQTSLIPANLLSLLLSWVLFALHVLLATCFSVYLLYMCYWRLVSVFILFLFQDSYLLLQSFFCSARRVISRLMHDTCRLQKRELLEKTVVNILKQTPN